MTVTCSPRLPALARIIAVLHARRADIITLRYEAGGGEGELAVGIGSGDVDQLAAHLRRVVDVTAVHVAVPARVAVAS